MTSSSLGESLKDLIVKRKQGDGEFCYVYLASGETITGKKAAFRVLQSDEAMYSDLRETCKLKNENDSAFDARVLKLLVSVPFESNNSMENKTPSKIAPKPKPATPAKSTPSKTIVSAPKKDLKTSLSKLIARRRLDGGEFSYVYSPLGKVINGKKAMYQFFKNQFDEFDQLKKDCKETTETEEAFDNRVMKEMLTVPYEKDVIPMDTDNDKDLPTTKRKSNLDIIDSKKARIDTNDTSGSFQYVYFESEILITSENMKSHKVLTQIGAVSVAVGTGVQKKFFKSVIGEEVNKASDVIHEKLNLTKSSRFAFSYKRFNKTENSKKFYEGLDEFIKYLESMKTDKNKLCFVTYRRESMVALFKVLNRFNYGKKFKDTVDSIVVLSQVFEKKPLKQYLPLKSISQFYFKTTGLNFHMKTPNAEDLADVLKKSCTALMKKHNFSLLDFASRDHKLFQTKQSYKTEDFKLESNMFCVVNSLSFENMEKFHDTGESSPSTSKVGSKAPKKSNEEEPEIMEICDFEIFDFVTVEPEIVYEVLTQPVLVKLGTMDENTKFVKFTFNVPMNKRFKANKVDLLRDSAKVFWRKDTPYAFCNLCPDWDNNFRYKPTKAKIIDTLSTGETLGTYKALNRTDEEQRNLSTKVQVDIVVTRAGNDSTKVNVNKEPTSVLVKLMLKPGSLTDGDIQDFQFRPSDVLICHKSVVKGVSIISKFISVDRKQGVSNRAKIVVKSDSHQLLSDGQILGTATLFQNDVKLVFQTLEKQSQVNTDVKSTSNVALMQVQHKTKKPLKTTGASRLYAQGVNPVLVKLDNYQATKLNPKFAKAYIEYSTEFNDIIDQNRQLLKIDKMSEKDKIVRVFWTRNIPYAFVNIRIPPVKNQSKVDFCDIIQNYEIGGYAPFEMGNPQPASKVTMHLCVDFDEKNATVQGIPTIIRVYLKFKDAEIDKKDVLEQYFSMIKVHHKRLEVLSAVIKPDAESKLAPQKTSTNDMKATLLVKSIDDEPVMLNAREVIADCESLDPEANLKQFNICGKKVTPRDQRAVMMSSEVEEMEMMDRQFNQGSRGGEMFTRRSMTPMDMFSNPFDDGFEEEFGFTNKMRTGGRGRGRGGMMGSSGRGMMRTGLSSHLDTSVGLDMDYMSYGNQGRSGFNGRSSMMGNGDRGGDMGFGRGNVKNRLGGVGGRPSQKTVIDPSFDSLYEPEFGSDKKQFGSGNVFEKAKANLSSGFSRGRGGGGGRGGFGQSSGGPGSYRGSLPRGGPPRGCWSK